jgi:excisionase family DNA binding protein
MEEKSKAGYLMHVEAARYLCISPKTLYNKVAQGEIPAYKYKNCKKNLYKISDLDGLLRPVR